MSTAGEAENKAQETAQAKSDATTGVDSLGKFVRRNLSARRLGLLLRRGGQTLKSGGWQALGREIGFRFRLATHGQVWRYRADIPLAKELRFQQNHRPEYAPLVSVVCPLYNTPDAFLRRMMDSVLDQSYDNLELVLADASDPVWGSVKNAVQNTAREDDRVKYICLDENKGIAQNTNAALKEARGEWICLLDHDDVLQENALYEVVKAAGEAGADLIYSDEVVLDESLKKLSEFHFKGGYGPDTLRGCNYITHLCAFSKTLLEEAGGQENPEYDGAQDYDLILRLSEKAKKIHHIPRVLYIWRGHAASTASGIAQKPQATQAGRRALQAHLERVGLAGEALAQEEHPGSYRVEYEVKGDPRVSVLIPSCDHTVDLARCLASLCQKAGWENMEVLVLDNNSKDPATREYYKKAREEYKGIQILHYEGEFNYSAINNFGAKEASGEHLLLLNNDVEILSEGFVREMLSYSQREDVGAVGAMLYYPDDTVQHAGLIVGIGGTAGVNHKGHPRGDGGDMFRLCTTQNVSAVTGAALMVKRSLYEELGGLDEKNFAVAFNDVDFCLRLREKGLWNVFTPFARAYHFESKTRGYDTEGEKKRRFDKEADAYREKWHKVLEEGDPFYNPHFTLKTENFALR